MSTGQAPRDGEQAQPAYARALLWVNVAVAWFAVLLSLTLNLSGYYVASADPAKPTIIGNVPSGIDTPLERFFDWTTFFTILSNVVVAVVVAMLVLRPGVFHRADRVGIVWRTLRLDSVLMIVITGVLYNLLLATGGLTGWAFVSNLFLHVLNPIVTALVWLLAGPRGLIRVSTVFLALVLPLAWAAYALIRGSVIQAWPYPFLDVATVGLPSALAFVAGVAVIGVLLGLALLGIDRLLGRRHEGGTG